MNEVSLKNDCTSWGAFSTFTDIMSLSLEAQRPPPPKIKERLEILYFTVKLGKYANVIQAQKKGGVCPLRKSPIRIKAITH